MKKQNILILLVLLSFSKGYSQMSLSPQASYLRVGTYPRPTSNFGLGIKGGYKVLKKTIAYGGFSYYFPFVLDQDSIYLNAYDYTTNPNVFEVFTEDKISFYHFFIGSKRYFGKRGNEGGFNFYLLVEAGFLLGAYSENLISQTYNEELYKAPLTDKKMLESWNVNFGFGFEKRILKIYLFTDFKLNMPATEVNGSAVITDLPPSIDCNLGLRFPFKALRKKRHRLRLR